MKTKNTFKKTLSGLALLSALTFGYNSNAQDITPTKVSTETNLQQTSVRDGVQLQRTEIDWDNVTVKYDAKSNLNPSVSKDNLSDVGGIYIDKLFGGPHYSVGGSVTQLGNWDDKSQAIFDGYVNLDYDKWKASFEKGHSIRNTAPMEFDIANVKFNSDDIRAKAEAYFVSNNGSMYNGEEKQSYEYVLLGNKNLSAAYAEANGVSHVLSTVNLNNKFGSFVWAYADRSKRNWAVRSRMALGETQEDTKGEDEENFRLEHDVTGIDEKYFDYGMNETALDGLIMPALYDMHLSPGIIRGKYSFSTTILANFFNASFVSFLLDVMYVSAIFASTQACLSFGIELNFGDEETSTI